MIEAVILALAARFLIGQTSTSTQPVGLGSSTLSHEGLTDFKLPEGKSCVYLAHLCVPSN